MATKLLVEGLDWAVGDAGLRAAFAPFGRVVEAKVAVDWETGRSRGFGHVLFDDETAARLATETMDGTRLAGKVLRVMAAPDQDRGVSYRGGDYGRVVADAKDADSAYRGGDYSDGRKTPNDRRVYRSADFGYADGKTPESEYRSADFDGGKRKPKTEPLPPLPEPAQEAPAGGSAGAPTAPAAAPGAAPAGPKRGGGHRDAAGGWTPGRDNEGVGGNDKKTFG